MSTEQSGVAGGAERLSALVDGELADDDVKHACIDWRADAKVRQSWHAYQLIGDVLRSEDLASAPGRDEAFLRSLRSRLADEPVVLAPRPAKALPMATGRSLRFWRAGAAVAAGFVAVGGVLVALQMPARDAQPQPGLAQAPAVPATVVPVSATAPVAATESAVEQAALVTDGQLIRDARLDRYLAAHQRFAGTSALGVPSAFLRSATATADGGKR